MVYMKFKVRIKFDYRSGLNFAENHSQYEMFGVILPKRTWKPRSELYCTGFISLTLWKIISFAKTYLRKRESP